jgi:hypothetical protein
MGEMASEIVSMNAMNVLAFEGIEVGTEGHPAYPVVMYECSMHAPKGSDFPKRAIVVNKNWQRI